MLEPLDHIRMLAAETWNLGFMGIAVGRIAIALLVLLAAALVRRLFSKLVRRYVHIRLGHAGTARSNAVIEALDAPVRSVPIVIAVFFISRFFATGAQGKALFADVNRSLVAFVVFWALFSSIAPLFNALDERSARFSRAMIGWTVRASRILVVLVGGAAILEIWGIRVGPILAGLGLFGAAVALGAQDLFKNLIAGVFIIAERRFQNGDWIKAEGVVEGTVETIGLRTTKVRRFDLAPVYVPNSKLADNAVVNYAQMTHYRISWIIGLEYDTTVDQLRRVRDGIEAYIRDSPDFVHPPDAPMFVRVDKFNESSIDLMVYCFANTTSWGEWLKIKEAMIYAFKNIVEGAGCGFAFPSRSLYVETLPAGMDVLSPHPPATDVDSPAAHPMQTAQGTPS
ncbi:MAG TPA: mechanosensitive ion channel family protein [Bordetella sp.]|uniref:mechanosensitive ion channel family protein n=1 Tax=Bordetella sp. TaxID=28081 RepID=UPI002ED5CE20